MCGPLPWWPSGALLPLLGFGFVYEIDPRKGTLITDSLQYSCCFKRVRLRGFQAAGLTGGGWHRFRGRFLLPQLWNSHLVDWGGGGVGEGQL